MMPRGVAPLLLRHAERAYYFGCRAAPERGSSIRALYARFSPRPGWRHVCACWRGLICLTAAQHRALRIGFMTIDLYALCPCGSGKKIKFCCRDIAVEIDKVERLLEAGQR